MKIGSNLLNAASAIALSTGIAMSGVGTIVLATTTVVEAAVVNSIVVRGNSRVDEATIRGNLTIEPGTRFNNGDVDDSVKRLFETGLFSDVRISVSGRSLIVTVDENQLINQVVFNGNEKLKDEQLKRVVQLSPLSSYNDLILDADINAIKSAYRGIGRDDAEVTTQVVVLANGRVNVAFNINEGGRTKIAAINFIGNNAFGDGRLANVISTKRSGFLSFLTRKDIYDEDKLRSDEELLRRFYYNNGYADFRVISSYAELDETTNEYTVTFDVDEGERYVFGDITVDSTVSNIDATSLSNVIKTKTGKTYSARSVEQTIEAISEEVAGQGYPFARVTPRGDRDFAGNTISVDYLIDQGTKAYVERIEIIGNTRTRDYVIRREFDLSEGDPFNQVLIRKARRRLEALGYFSNVDISTRPGSEADRVVVVVNVTDQPTGEFGIDGGYSNVDGFSAGIDFKEKNFLGRGQFIRAAVGRGQNSQTYEFSFTEPYFLGYRLAAGFDIFSRESTGNVGYDINSLGGALRISAPLTDNLSLALSYNFNRDEYKLDGGTIASNAEAATIATGERTKSSLAYSLTYNSLDNQLLPRDGMALRLTQEFAGLGGDANFLKTTAKFTAARTISETSDVIGTINAGAGHVFATTGNLNVFDHFMLGSEIIRGFDSEGFGPKIAGTSESAGGTTYFNASAEVSAPLPLISRELGLRLNLFADVATLYGNDIDAASLGAQTVQGSSLSWRASVGAGITWASPFGPLRVYYAEPVLKESFDKVRKVGFGASTRF